MKKMRFFAALLFSSILLLLASCQDDDMDVSPEEQAPSAVFSAPTTGKTGEPILFTDSSTDADGTIVTWAWDLGDGKSSTVQNPTHTYATAGTYEVRLTVTDDSNLSSSATNSITISEGTDDLDAGPDDPEPVETGLFNRTFFHDGKQLEYAVYIPTSYTGDVEVPLVLYLHGAPENKEVAQSTTDFTAVAESEGFIVVYPEAGFASSGGFIWAEGRGGNADGSSDDVSYINALVDSVTNEFQVNASKRYLCGFSNGGFMVQNVANQDNSRFAAMATVSASLHETFANTNPNPISMLYIYGTDDPVTNYENGGLPPASFNLDGWTVPALAIESAVDYWVGINECNTTPTETELTDSDTGDNSTVTVFEYTGGTGGTKVKFYRINGGGHTWPGVPVSSRPASFFEDTNNDIKAGQEIWNFFNEFELN